jgi:hypothetical protein
MSLAISVSFCGNLAAGMDTGLLQVLDAEGLYQQHLAFDPRTP